MINLAGVVINDHQASYTVIEIVNEGIEKILPSLLAAVEGNVQFAFCTQNKNKVIAEGTKNKNKITDKGKKKKNEIMVVVKKHKNYN